MPVAFYILMGVPMAPRDCRLGMVGLLNLSGSNRCVMVTHCGFNFHFSND